jgi:hypothetical protein
MKRWPDQQKKNNRSKDSPHYRHDSLHFRYFPPYYKNKWGSCFQLACAQKMKTIVADYLKRWSIEMLIKDEKQHFGLGDYRVLRCQDVVRHLHLVDCAYACLTHIGIKIYGAQGQNRSKKVLRRELLSKTQK